MNDDEVLIPKKTMFLSEMFAFFRKPQKTGNNQPKHETSAHSPSSYQPQISDATAMFIRRLLNVKTCSPLGRLFEDSDLSSNSES